MMLKPWAHLLSALFFLNLKDGQVGAHESTLSGQTQDVPVTSSSEEPTPRQQLPSVPESVFTLKVLVNDLASGRPLSKATVDLYVNHTRTRAALTGEDGAVWLRLSYQQGLPLTIVASMEGYILSQLPWEITRMPIFSSVTLSLFPLNQGNIWLFEDSVLITDRASAGVDRAVSQPSVQFPTRLLNLSNADIVSSVRAFLTVPKVPAGPGRGRYPLAMGLLVSGSGHSSVDLSPVGAVSVLLYSNDRETPVSGPVQISLPVTHTSGLRPAHAVPAWSFDRNTGAWMESGLGVVNLVEGEMIWTFNASHLGYWIAAPLPLTQGDVGLAIPVDLISPQTSFLTAIVGGAMLLLIGVFAVLLCGRRASLSQTTAQRIRLVNVAVSKTDQTTSTYDNQLCEVSSQESLHHHDGSNQSVTGGGVSRNRNDSTFCRQNGNLNIYVEESELCDVRFYGSQSEFGEASRHRPLNASGSDLPSSHGTSELTTVPLSVNEGVFFHDGLVYLFNRPLAVLHAPGLSQEPPPPSQSATLPRTGAPDHSEVRKDSFAQTHPMGPPCARQGPGEERQAGALEERQGPSSSSRTRGHCSNLPESFSVPGTLYSVTDRGRSGGPSFSELQGKSYQAPEERSEPPGGTPPRPPRAWFVSLEGKPAAEIHRSVVDPQRRRRPADGRGASLDSGVDMGEPSQPANRRPVTLEHDRTFVRSSSQSKLLLSEGAGLNHREGATSATNDLTQGNMMDTRTKDLAQGNMMDTRGDEQGPRPGEHEGH